MPSRFEPQWSVRLRMWVGRRGAMLALAAAVDIIYGAALATTPADTAIWWPAASHELFRFPVPAWGLVWIAIGVVLLTGIPRRIPDGFHFGLAVALWSWWSVASVLDWVTTDSPGLWGLCAIYAGLALGLLVAAGWEDPP